MNTEKKVKDLSFKLAKSPGSLISFVGISFLILGTVNFYINIPSEYVVSISFAAFFFVCADFIAESKPITKIKLNLHSIFLFLGVFSFSVIPALSFSFPKAFEYLVGSSESLSIISLGLVLVIINLKMWDTEEKIYTQVIETADMMQEVTRDFRDTLEKSENLHENSEIIISELESEIERLKLELHEQSPENKQVLTSTPY